MMMELFVVALCFSLGHAFRPTHRHFCYTRSRLANLAYGSTDVPIISGLSEIVDSYDGFLVDQWGVLFDANAPYEGARNALEKLKEAGKLVVLLSNSSKRRADAMKNLIDKMKFGPPGPEGLYLDIITSGEVAHDLVSRSATGNPAIRPGTKVFVCGSGDGDEAYVAGLGCTVSGPLECDWVLARGNFVVLTASSSSRDSAAPTSGGEGKEEEEKATVVKQAVPSGSIEDNFAEQTAFYSSDESGLGVACRRGVPMLVANPDMIRPGTNSPMPGKIGQLWASGTLGLKGEVVYVGKPYESVYRAALEVLAAHGSAEKTAPLRLCGVGDALGTDILGAARHLPTHPWSTDSAVSAAGGSAAGESGAESEAAESEGGRVLIAHGIHANSLGVEEGKGQEVGHEQLGAFLRKQGCCGVGGGEGTATGVEKPNETEVPGERKGASCTSPPTHVAPAFVW